MHPTEVRKLAPFILKWPQPSGLTKEGLEVH